MRLTAPERRGSAFDSILQAYEFKSVVFGGYKPGTSTKHVTHLCRSVGKKEQHVHFQAGMKLQTSKEEFLVTVENMDPFIKAMEPKFRGNVE